jgi:single-strand DNA-binding protein
MHRACPVEERVVPKLSPSSDPRALACNLVVLSGHLSRPPEVRELPSGEVVVAYDVTVRRPGHPAESVPVAWAGPSSGVSLLDAGPGDAVVVVGRVRRRFFRAGGTTQSRTEVVAESLSSPKSPARARATVERALRRALDELTAPDGDETPVRGRRSGAKRA